MRVEIMHDEACGCTWFARSALAPKVVKTPVFEMAVEGYTARNEMNARIEMLPPSTLRLGLAYRGVA